MATSALSTNYGSSVRTDMITWAQGFSNFLVANGFSLTSDTGQIVFASATLSGSNYWGYQMFKFNDSLQSTTPFFMYVGYYNTTGFYNNSTGQPMMRIQFGTSTDGAGNLTGTISPAYNLGTTQGVIAAPPYQQCYLAAGTDNSGAGSWFTAAMFDGSSFQNPWFMSVERTKDNSGNPNSDGIIINLLASGFGLTSFVLPSAASGFIPLAPNGWFAAPINFQQSSMAGSGIVGVSFPVCYNGRPYQQGIGCAIYQAGDFGPTTTNAFTVYGTSHTYRVPTTTPPVTLIPSGGSARLMLRYE